MKEQRLLVMGDGYCELERYLSTLGSKHIFLVHGMSFRQIPLAAYWDGMISCCGMKVTHFTEFQPNPLVESVHLGVKRFLDGSCDMIAGIGGGSAMDVAKCIKRYVEEGQPGRRIPFWVMPTTAGSGSEATHFAVVYEAGEKRSISHENMLPDAICLDPSALDGLPSHQRKTTVLDAFCHAMESCWSLQADAISRCYAGEALRILVGTMRQYVRGETTREQNSYVLYGAYLAGKAINLSKTTAGHAMAYKLTSIFGLEHGHAAALCNARLLGFMEGYESMGDTLRRLSEAVGRREHTGIRQFLEEVLAEWGFHVPLKYEREADFRQIVEQLSNSVYPDRLKNYPLRLEHKQLQDLYRLILSGRFWREGE